MQRPSGPRWKQVLVKSLSFIGCSLLVGYVCLVANAVLAGADIGGPINLDFGGLVLCFCALVSLLCSHWLLPLPGGLMSLRVGGAVLIAITVWWSFWLPSSYLDIGYSLRYDIPDPYIFPASPDVPIITMLLAAFWLTLETAKGPMVWIGHRAVILGLTALCLLIEQPWAELPMRSESPAMLWWSSLIFVVGLFLWGVLRRKYTNWAAVMLAVALQAVVVGFWDGVYLYAEQVPNVVNRFGRDVIY